MDNLDIDLLALRSFCVLMEERSVSRAAFRLGVKQPTMSRMLAKLRAYFGDSLLVWAGGHMVPTPRALFLEGEVRPILSTMTRISTPATPFAPNSSEHTFRLVATGYLENVYLAKVMAKIAVRAPGIKIEIQSPNRFNDATALEKGEVDFLVGWNTAAGPTLRSRLLFSDKIVCIARADHPALQDNRMTLERFTTLFHVQFDIPARTTTELLVQETLAGSGHRLNVKFRVQSFWTIAEVVANSDLVATVSKRFATSLLKTYALKILEPPLRLPPIQNRAFWHERMHTDPGSLWFRKLLAEVAKAG